MEERVVFYGDTELRFQLHRKNVKNINIRIKHTGEVAVSANAKVEDKTVDDFVRSKSRWILKHLEKFQATRIDMPPRELVSGESYLYLGQQYRLKVMKSKLEYVDIDSQYIYIYVKNPNNYSRKNNLLNQWYNKQFRIIVQEQFEAVTNHYISFFNDSYEYKTLEMVARWGSCIVSKKRIILNSKLIYAPRFCIDYVILHELIHFKEKNHSKKFYAILDNLMPDWRERKTILDKEIIKYIR